MPLDSFISRLNLFRHPVGSGDLREKQSSITGGNSASQLATNSSQPHGHFDNAHDFVLNNPFIGDVINNMIYTGRTALEYLSPYTMPDAAMDSSARHPPPKCHPGTRLYIGNKLKGWLYNTDRRWNMIWLHGFAGTGKSAVAQTFAERCAELGRLGGAYFISRSNNRNRPEPIVPSLVYQLAVNVPEYKSIITTALANDPQLLEKASPIQFKKLIIEPLLTLQRQRSREPMVIILDGLDECKGMDAQLEIIDMITEAIRLYPDLPLLWLISSRPEVHLKHTFARVLDCGREELIIDAECRDDVERYLREEIAKIKAKYSDVTPPDWPSVDQLKKLFDRVSGLFVLASTVLKHLGDPTRSNPVGQLGYIMACLEDAQAIGSSNPLATLDLLYTQILGDIPPEVSSTTWRILAYSVYMARVYQEPLMAQVLCNYLRLDQYAFYSALRGLHSVIEVPEPHAADQSPLRFYHTSFMDFLLNQSRSGKFVIIRMAMTDIAKSVLFWYDVDLTCFHTHDAWNFDSQHRHDPLPGLTWVSVDNKRRISESITKSTTYECWDTLNRLSPSDVDADLLSQIYNFNFRYAGWSIWILANWFHEHRQDFSHAFVRTEPSCPTDFRLLEYFKLVIGNGFATPAKFPLDWNNPLLHTREYFIIGVGTNSLIVWITKARERQSFARDLITGTWTSTHHVLNEDQAPTGEMISRYQEELEKIKWKEPERSDGSST